MNRLLGALLVSVFSFLLIAPALSDSPESQLPACCRTNGKHKCAMGSQHSSDSGATSIYATCPFSGHVTMTAANSGKLFTASASVALSGTVMSQPARHAQIEALGRISFSRARQKRGPPSLLL